MPVVSSSECRWFATGRSRIAGIATQSSGAGRIVLWRSCLDEGAAVPGHRHDGEEVTLVLAGDGWIDEAGRESPFTFGDVLIVPSHTLHRVSSAGGCELVSAFPAGTRHFTGSGEEMTLPWNV